MLYNEFRPNNFKDVKGQKENKQILLNQLRENNPSHAYIFHGLHGSGKTTCAKIFAKALNCLDPKEGQPCNQCASCKEFNDNTNTDIYEIDAASNNKVEDIAKIKDIIMYPPQRAYKVFILDEAHMLSKAAWNSLLTTIEEAPKKVIFIFCSTELNKFPETIISRCMNLTFSNISNAEIIENLKHISETKNFNYEVEGLSLIASVSNGSMRDALSNLEKCISYGPLTPINVSNTLGLVDQGSVFSLLKSMVTNDIEGTLNKIEYISNLGKDIYELTREILESLRDINVYSLTKNANIISKNIKYVSAFKVDTNEVTQAVNKFYMLLESIRNTDNKKILLDIAAMEVSSLFHNASVDDFKTTVEIVSASNNITTPSNIEKPIEENKTEKNNESKKLNYFLLLPKKVDLLKSFDINDPQLKILLFSKIYTKHNTFVIKGPEVSKLNKQLITSKLSDICKANINIEFIS